MYAGYATPKEYSVFGPDKYVSDVDLKPYSLLTYASGVGNKHPKSNPANYADSIQNAAIAKSWGTHGNADVLLFATGALANFLFSGSIDQNYIPHALAFATCIFNYKERCIAQQYPTEASKYRAIHQIRDKLRENSYQKVFDEEEPTTVRGELEPTEFSSFGVVRANNYDHQINQNKSQNVYSSEYSPFTNQYSELTDKSSGCKSKASITISIILLILLVR